MITSRQIYEAPNSNSQFVRDKDTQLHRMKLDKIKNRKNKFIDTGNNITIGMSSLLGNQNSIEKSQINRKNSSSNKKKLSLRDVGKIKLDYFIFILVKQFVIEKENKMFTDKINKIIKKEAVRLFYRKNILIKFSKNKLLFVYRFLTV